MTKVVNNAPSIFLSHIVWIRRQLNPITIDVTNLCGQEFKPYFKVRFPLPKWPAGNPRFLELFLFYYFIISISLSLKVQEIKQNRHKTSTMKMWIRAKNILKHNCKCTSKVNPETAKKDEWYQKPPRNELPYNNRRSTDRALNQNQRKKSEWGLTWGLVTRENPSEWRTGLESNGLRNSSNLLIAIFSQWKLGFGEESWETGRTLHMKTVGRSALIFFWSQRTFGRVRLWVRVTSRVRAFFNY